ncbi:hypothetical protein BW727_101380 [Jeotgalibaca dankookensis]|uniref:AP2/ERF domain-containing protein n=1 Tax=Jeotgalibaca dankookensis TaxID=708126 RepID=A0A1S6IQB4_9LACT|nr:AP2 domain-containing protein [Jeotgalibaca dankookensis]AQS53747.1 hypothetical protein BW727_101380 [Jeotgalibaca dankookensis]
MKKRIDLTGRQFNDLTVLSKAGIKERGRFWNVKCVCGKEFMIEQSLLKNGVIKDCGHESLTQTVKKKKSKKASNGTGYVGVTKNELKSGTRYKANISVKGKNKHLGTFLTLEEAIAARQEAEEKYR